MRSPCLLIKQAANVSELLGLIPQDALASLSD